MSIKVMFDCALSIRHTLYKQQTFIAYIMLFPLKLHCIATKPTSFLLLSIV